MNRLQGPEYANMTMEWTNESGSIDNQVERRTNFSVEVTSGKEEVMTKLEKGDISLDTLVETKSNEKKTAMQMCLEDINNGHEVIKGILDKLVIRNDENGIIKVNVGKLYKSSPKLQSKIVTELIMARATKKKDSRAFNTLTNLLRHPVISAFIMEKWRPTKLFFTIHTRMYMFFLLLYTLFMYLNIIKRLPIDRLCQNTTRTESCNSSPSIQMKNISCISVASNNSKLVCTCEMIICAKDFSSDWSAIILTIVLVICILQTVKQAFKIRQKIITGKKIEAYIKAVNTLGLLLVDLVLGVAIAVDRQNISVEQYFKPYPFLQEWCNGFSIIEFLFLLSAIYLCIKEILNPRHTLFSLSYHKELKKVLEWIALLSAFVAMYSKGVKITEDSNGWTAGVTSLGISSGWMVFVFKMGEPRFSVFGNFITMNYNILKRIYAYILVIVYTITGFALAFWILEHKLRKKEYHFVGPFEFEMTSITMAMGEFGFREGFQQAFSENWVVGGFSMVLLFFMIVTVTITMLNLLLAAIIKDHEVMLKDVYVQNLVFMANYINTMEIVVYKSNVTSFLIRNSKFMRTCCEDILTLDENHFGRYCSNQLCSKECESKYHIEPHYNTLIEELEKILNAKT